MTTTQFITPRNVVEHTTDQSIAWTHVRGSIGGEAGWSSAITAKELHTIPGLWQERFASKTNQLWFTNFGFNPIGTRVSGIEVQFNVQRLDRLQDYTVHLCLYDQLIGDNIATPDIIDLKIYGDSTNLWGTSLSLSDITEESFGVVIALRSNVTVPHKDLGNINQVAMRITYA
jgi:hypothetical protein